MSIELGNDPESLTVTLITGGDFDAGLVLEDENGDDLDWPVGTVLTLRFSRTADIGETWTATIDGAEAAWDVDKAVVDATIAAGRTKVRLVYVNDDDDDVLAIGTVTVRG
jgi:hypothetical protein